MNDIQNQRITQLENSVLELARLAERQAEQFTRLLETFNKLVTELQSLQERKTNE